MTSQVSRPMQIVLLVTIVFCLAWFAFLRPKPASTAATAPAPATAAAAPAATDPAADSGAVSGVTGAADQARAAAEATEQNAQAKEDAGNAIAGTSPSASSADPGASAGATTGRQADRTGARGDRRAPDARGSAPEMVRGPAGPAVAARALESGKVLAVLFWNPRASDDRAVNRSLGALDGLGRGVVRVSAPLPRLSSFKAVTAKVAVTGSPSYVVFDRSGESTSLVGFADGAELRQRIDDALARP